MSVTPEAGSEFQGPVFQGPVAQGPISQGMVNVRDVGGLATEHGRRTAHGVLYRSDAPRPAEEPPPHLPSWPPTLVLDLREPGEWRKAHPLEAPGTTVVQVPLLGTGPPRSWRQLPPLKELYQGALRRAGERISEVLELLVRARGPALVHCAAGKDRTGVLVALLLRSAGVSRDEVLADYVRTKQHHAALARRLRWDVSRLDPQERERAQALLGISEPAMATVLDTLDAARGGVTGWLSAKGVRSATIDAWMDKLVS